MGDHDFYSDFGPVARKGRRRPGYAEYASPPAEEITGDRARSRGSLGITGDSA
jgi:hypothetical protein